MIVIPLAFRAVFPLVAPHPEELMALSFATRMGALFVVEVFFVIIALLIVIIKANRHHGPTLFKNERHDRFLMDQLLHRYGGEAPDSTMGRITVTVEQVQGGPSLANVRCDLFVDGEPYLLTATPDQIVVAVLTKIEKMTGHEK